MFNTAAAGVFYILMAEKPKVLPRDTIRDRISVATKLLRGCVHNGHVKGIQRLSRKLRAEVEFLESVRRVATCSFHLNTVS